MSSALKKIHNHKRVSSTGTTGNVSYSSDDDDNLEMETADVTIRDHVTRQLFSDRAGYEYSSVNTVSDKVRGLSVTDRNSSDSSMYSDLDIEKCDLEVISAFDLKDDNDSKSAASGSDQIDWSGSVEACKDQLVMGLQVSRYFHY
uniref:Uncharacterized protein n=1 Tax=Dendroctonus ponderosae TaxID=77166 RepID=A0AAR5PBH2_DENPD